MLFTVFYLPFSKADKDCPCAVRLNAIGFSLERRSPFQRDNHHLRPLSRSDNHYRTDELLS
jgi:hypothetical protein